MSICRCASYEDLNGRPALNKRGHDTGKIINSLELMAAHPDKENKLYRCSFCGQLLQKSLDWARGNKPYVFKVPDIQVEDWIKEPFVQPDELFNRVAHIEQYLKRATFEEQATPCKSSGCEEKAVKLSVLCAFHHMLSIGFKANLPGNCRWFHPYVKSNYEFSIQYLKSLPTYKALK